MKMSNIDDNIYCTYNYSLQDRTFLNIPIIWINGEYVTTLQYYQRFGGHNNERTTTTGYYPKSYTTISC